MYKVGLGMGYLELPQGRLHLSDVQYSEIQTAKCYCNFTLDSLISEYLILQFKLFCIKKREYEISNAKIL